MGSSRQPEHAPERKVNAVPRRLADTSKAREMLGFETEVGLEEGLRGLVEWWRKEKDAALGAAAMTQSLRQIPVARPVLDEAEVEAVRRVVLSGWVTQGPEVAAFEAEFAGLVGAPHACAVSNCTTALHLALRVLGVGPGSTRSSPSAIPSSPRRTRSATAARMPVFVDIEAGGYNIDPALVEEAITPAHRARSCASTSSACPATWHRSSRSAASTAFP